MGVFVPIWLILHRCDATNLGVFDLCHFALLKRGCANSGGLEIAEKLRGFIDSSSKKTPFVITTFSGPDNVNPLFEKQ